MDRLIYISTAYLPSRSAHSVHVMKMSSAFGSSLSGSVVLTGFRPAKEDELNIFRYYNVPQNFEVFRLRNYFGRFFSLIMAICVFSYPVNNTVYYTRNTIVAFFLSITKRKFFYEIHDFYPSLVRRLFERSVIRSPHMYKCYVISEGLKKDFLSRYPTQTCEVLHDGADVTKMEERTHKKGKTVGYVGSLYKGRGIELIIELASSRPDYDFLIIGGSLEQIKDYKKGAKNIANCRFIGHVAQSDLLEYYNSMDILLMPYSPNLKTDSNGINTAKWMSPLKLFEYMSLGIPIVSSDLPTIKEIVSHNEVALLNYGKLSEWQETIDDIFASYEFYLARALKLKLRFENSYTWHKRVEIILSAV